MARQSSVCLKSTDPEYFGLSSIRIAKDALRSFSEVGPKMYYVYRIESTRDPSRTYTGFTEDLKERDKALDFERYLKTGSGKAFARKRLW